jgi:hypothetical protein
VAAYPAGIVIHEFFVEKQGHYVRFDELVLKSELKKKLPSLDRPEPRYAFNFNWFWLPFYGMSDIELYAQDFGTIRSPSASCFQRYNVACVFVVQLKLFYVLKVDL